MKCKNCGYDSNEKICPACGSELIDGDISKDRAENKEIESKYKLNVNLDRSQVVLILIAIAVCILIVIGNATSGCTSNSESSVNSLKSNNYDETETKKQSRKST